MCRPLTSPLLTRIGVPHAFSTRLGGVSAPPFASLNFGNPSALPDPERDPRENIRRNWSLLLRTIGAAGREAVQVHQVHGDGVLVVEPGTPARADGPETKADAIVTADPARLLAVRVADCAPVLVTSLDARHVAAIHAGWRGAIAGVAPRAVEAMRRLGARGLAAAVGPCLAADAFEVGPEVAEQFEAAFGRDSPVIVRGQGRPHIDLKLALAIQLRAAGVDQIDVLPHCSFRDANLFFSHRRERGVTGRMVGVIGPKSSVRSLQGNS